MTTSKFLGIVVTPANVQTEGLARVFDNLELAGATAVAIDPWLLRPAEPGRGARVPDLHIDGHQRVYTRPVLGRRALHVEAFLAFEPTAARYAGGVYQPAWRPAPAGLDTDLPRRMLIEAQRRGLEVHMGFAPLLPPEPRPEDQPVRVDGVTLPPPLVARTVCLNSPAGRHYALAFVVDLLAHYPELDGLILDWVEFGAYRLEEHFTCFCAHCALRARQYGLDWEAVQRDVAALWDWLHALTPSKLAQARLTAASPAELLEQLVRYPGWLAFVGFKARCVAEFFAEARARMNRLGGERVRLTARGWCPPWNRSSGLDYRALAKVCQAVAPKFFTFDHAAIPRWFGQTLREWNPDLSEGEILDAVIGWLNLTDDIEARTFAHYGIPAPGEAHPARLEVYKARLDEIAGQVNGQTRWYPIAHPYLPKEQWEGLVALIRDSRAHGMWINDYGFLSDARLERLQALWSA